MQYDYWSRNNSRLNFKRHKKKHRVNWFIYFLGLLVAYLILSKAFSCHFIPPPGTLSEEGVSAGAETGENRKDAADTLSDASAVEASAPVDPWDLALGGSGLQKKRVTVASGDTLINILLEAGLPNPDAYGVVNVMKDVYDPADLRQGQELSLSFSGELENEALFKGLCLKLDVDREIQVMRCPDLEFQAREFVRELDTRPATAAAEIDSSLYEAALAADLPIQVLMQMVRAYAFDVDFQRDIQPGDSFKVLYEKKVNGKGKMLKSGRLLYAVLHTRGRTLPIYSFESAGGEDDFFDENGKSVRKTLMVTPVDGARISSRYGMRRHPIQGYNKMHRGLDFAAPSGTPIMAAGDGIVEYAGRNGGYGNYIRIRHPNEYKTIYGHMSKYARGIRKGVRVKQGDTIGYVGSTGVSTGPHLHYEVQHRRKAVNPASVKTPPGRTLEGEELQDFLLAKTHLEKTYASLESVSQGLQAGK